ncbi:MAG TPA: hypothetical protein VF244_06915 [Acidimicrobiales bacterium]
MTAKARRWRGRNAAHYLQDGRTAKLRYADEALARGAAQAMVDRENLGFAAYLCPTCNAWHVGRTRTRVGRPHHQIGTPDLPFDITLDLELGQRATQFLVRENSGPGWKRRGRLAAFAVTAERIRRRDSIPA